MTVSLNPTKIVQNTPQHHVPASAMQKWLNDEALVLRVFSNFYNASDPLQTIKTCSGLKGTCRLINSALSHFPKPSLDDDMECLPVKDDETESETSEAKTFSDTTPLRDDRILNPDSVFFQTTALHKIAVLGTIHGEKQKKLAESLIKLYKDLLCSDNKCFHKETLSTQALCSLDYPLASFYSQHGSDLNILPEMLSIGIEHKERGVRGSKLSDSLFIDHPKISQAILEARFKAAQNDIETIDVLEAILLDSCRMGYSDGVKWVVYKLNKNKHLSWNITTKPLEAAIEGGFDQIIKKLIKNFDFSHCPKRDQSRLIDLCLKMGHPASCFALGKIGWPLSKYQYSKLANTLRALTNAYEIVKNVNPPVPNHPVRDSEQGGNTNFKLYQKEYVKAVAAYWILLKEKDCDVVSLIETLGHRRRRMARLGSIFPMESFGYPCIRRMMRTPFGSTFAVSGEKINKKYQGRLPLTVTYPIGTDYTLYLTEFHSDKWIHGDPYENNAFDLKKKFNEGLKEIARLTRGVIVQTYPNVELLARDIYRIYWLFSHLAPFERGTPTVSGIFIDAVWLCKGYHPPIKTFDENCEALCYDTWEEFAGFMAQEQVAAKSILELQKMKLKKLHR